MAAVFFVLLSFFFILSAKGYAISFGLDGITFQRTGMLIISSKPTGSKIFLNAKDTGKTTGFFSVKLDHLWKKKYHLKLTKDGYFSWEKDVLIQPEMVTWANYVLLFPKNPVVESKSIQGNLAGSLTSQDSKAQFFLTQAGDTYTFSLFNDSTGENKKIFDTAALTPDKKITGILLLDWSKDKRLVLFKGQVGGQDKLFVLNTDSKSLLDLSAITADKFDQLAFDPANSDLLYGLSGGSLVNINLRTNTVSTIMETQVLYFAFGDDGKIYYVKDNSGQRSFLQANGDLSGKNILADSIPSSPSYAAKIETQSQQVALKTADNTLYLITSTEGKNMLITFAKNVSDFSWSPDGSRLLYIGNGKVTVFENNDIQKSSTEYIMPEGSYHNLMWYDSRHILGEQGSHIVVMDFDETNCVTLGNADANIRPFFSSDNGDILFFSKIANNQSELSRYKVKF